MASSKTKPNLTFGSSHKLILADTVWIGEDHNKKLTLCLKSLSKIPYQMKLQFYRNF